MKNRGRRRIAVVAGLVVALLAAPISVPRAQAAGCSGGTTVLVAHQDDDLLFINPDVVADIKAGKCVQTIFLTAGDAGSGNGYALEREQGSEAAYANMAGVSNSWTTGDAGAAGKSIQRRTLRGAPNVSLVSLRLPDGNLNGSGFVGEGYQSLQNLEQGSQSRITAVDNSASYSANELLTTLVSLAYAQGATSIRTQNYVGSYDDGDHSDHHAAAYFAYDANDYLVTARTLSGYVGYQTQNMAANVTGTKLTQKQNAFNAYAAHDGNLQGIEFPYWGTKKYFADQTSFAGTTVVVANAGPAQVVAAGTKVTLDGSGSTPGISYSWGQTSGPATVTLSNATAANPAFTPTVAGQYQFQLTVSSSGKSATSTVAITVQPAGWVNLARVSGTTVTASAQDTAAGQGVAKAVDGVAQGYPADSSKEWVAPGGKAGTWIQLSWASPVTMTSVVLYDRPNLDDQATAGTLTFSDSSTLSVPSINNGGGATTVTFPAKSTTSLKYTINSVSSTTYNVGLAEFEAYGTVGQPPVANAGPAQNVQAGTQVTLDGSASTVQSGKTIAYSWAQTTGSTVQLSGTTVAKPTFTPTASGTYTFSLTVSDGTSTATSSVVITVIQPNRAPVANAGVPQATQTGTLVTLDGSASSDPDGNTLSFAWAQIAGSPAQTLSSISVSKPTFTPATPGDYTFQLTASDGSLS